MKTAFEKFDENGDGVISPDEFCRGIMAMDIRIGDKAIQRSQIQKIVQVLDQDKDGCISYHEFGALFSREEDIQTAENRLGDLSEELREVIKKNRTNLRKIFHAFDLDGDGSISPSELRMGLRAQKIKELSAAQVGELIEVMDANGDGKIDWNEFQNVFGEGETGGAARGARPFRRPSARCVRAGWLEFACAAKQKQKQTHLAPSFGSTPESPESPDTDTGTGTGTFGC